MRLHWDMINVRVKNSRRGGVMIRKNALMWTSLSDSREHYVSTGRYATFEIDSGYALSVLSHKTTFYTGTTCKAKKLGDWLNNRSRLGLWCFCSCKKAICLLGRLIKFHQIKCGYDIEHNPSNIAK